ncbi:MAG: type II toxin-antitoxin system VapC family toxin [bacterium]|nr:type II toxin-antitoxin system VapC family toxin [bacterium]
MKQIVFDSDVLIDLLRGVQSTYDQVTSLTEDAELCCSVITLAEIYAGMFPREKKATDQLLNSLVHIPVTDTVAATAGRLRNKYKQIELMDCLIAASAMGLGAYLLTKNIKHYPMENLRLLPIK